MYNFVFPLNLMCSLGYQFSGRFLSHYKFRTIAARDLVCGIGLSESELQILLESALDSNNHWGRTCLRSMGVLISGTLVEMKRVSASTSIGCLTIPAIVNSVE